MKQLDIKKYVAEEKARLKQYAIDEDLDNFIKLGIVDATRPDDAANQIYIKSKVKDFQEMGWKAEVYPVDHYGIRQAIYEAELSCSAIIVQLPVREGVRFTPDMIERKHDCDGLRHDSYVNPATPQGILDYLKACEFPFSGKTAVVVGRSEIVGKPMAKLLLNEDMTVSVCHSKTDPSILSGLLCDADLVVVATGHPHLIYRGQCTGAVVVDVGINRLENGKIIGDFDEQPWYQETTTKQIWSTPVPGGVGLLTRLALLKNVVALTEREFGGWRETMG